MKRAAIAGIASLACACTLQSQADGITDGVRITSDRASLADRVRYADTPVAIRAVGQGQRSAQAVEGPEVPTLTLVAEVDPPIVRGTEPHPDGTADHYEHALQATHVAIRGDTAVVSYHQVGSVYAGAVDVFDIADPAQPALVSHAAFELGDANSVALVGDSVYVAGSTWNPAAAPITAVVDRFELTDTGLTTAGAQRWGLGGHVGTGVAVDGDRVYASSGAAGDIALLGDDESLLVYAGLARWIAADDGIVAALIAGDDEPARVRVLDGDNLATERDIVIPGADGVDAKNTLDVAGARAYVAAGQAGLHVVDLATGELLQQRLLPTDSGYAPEDVATNSVSRDGRIVFTANGALGAWVARAGDDGRVDTLGALELGSSANHVAYADGWLFVAGGTRGLQIIRVTDIDGPYACGPGDDMPSEFIAANAGAPQIHGRDIYWPQSDGHIWTASVLDGVPRALAPAAGYKLVATDAYVYWIEESNGLVKRARRDTGAVEILASGQVRATALAVTDAHAYWGRQSGGKETAQVLRVALDGGPVEVFDTSFVGPAWYIQADDTHLYYTALYSGAVFRKPLAGGPRQVVAQRGGGSTFLALKGDYVYFTAGHSSSQIAGLGHVSRAPKDGSGPLETIIESVAAANPNGLAVDDHYVYWTHLDGNLRRAPLDFSSVETIVPGPGSLGQIAIDDTFVYWVDYTRRAIRRMCKPH